MQALKVEGEIMETLEDMRKSIDNIDNAIVAMFAERFKVTNRVGYYKAENGLPPKDSGRESNQYKRVNEISLQYGLDPEFAEGYLSAIISKVIENHEEIAKNF
jgi:chorismate mutase